jgi:phosphoribosylglycinamide formyltransferase-1
VTKLIKVTFLASGNGGNLKFLHELVSSLYVSNIELSIIADRECGASKFALENSLELQIVNVQKNEQIELSDAIKSLDPTLVFTTIHKVISPQVLQIYGNKMINLHYSQLPLYSGVIGMRGVELATKNRDTLLGVTTHRVTRDLDAGPILIQSNFRNPHSFDVSANASFRIGCLQIWSILQEIRGVKSQRSARSTTLIKDVIVNHSHPIPVFPDLVDEAFWKYVSNL